MAGYKLSATLTGHDNDVRGVLFPTSKVVLSASRDNTTRLWKLVSDQPPSYEATIASHSGHWLNALTYLPPSPQYPEGLIIAGGKDLIVEVRQPSRSPDQDAEALLLGHSNTICSLDVDPAGKFIVSGAWDNEARIWPVGKWDCETVLSGHEGSVWAVVAYDSETIITGSADQKIRIFHTSGKLQKEFQASNTPIRALCRLHKSHSSGAQFAAADNEGIIRFWTLEGRQVGELHGHESFIYSLASLPTGEIVSSGEDRTVRIWSGSECIQTITHPAISVWSVAVCAENGDIVSGASDKIVRVFSRNPERAADAATLARFEEAVKGSSIPQQTMGEINKEKLPGPSFLTSKSGTKDGQVQMIREENGSVTAHTWSAAQGQWISVGTVVESVGSSGAKQVYNGKEYDFVFDVDMEDGKPALKLPYNLSENPNDAATRFITANDSPASYHNQIVEFIIQNTQGHTIGQSQQNTSAPDPWGSDNRYRPGDASASTPAAVVPPPKVLPQKNYLNIVVARVPAIEKKIREINTTLLSEGHKDKSLNPTELSVLATACKNLESSSASKVTKPELDLAVKLALVWPYKQRLPGIDLLRLLAVSPAAATYSHPRVGNLINILEAAALEDTPPAENHVMMAVRAIANLFESSEGRTLASQEFERAHAIISSSVALQPNRNLLVAATTVYINYAVLLSSSETPNFEHVIAAIDALTRIIAGQSDSEAVYRAMVAAGTLVGVDAEAKSAAKDVYGLREAVTKAVGKASDPRIKNVGREVLGLLQ